MRFVVEQLSLYRHSHSRLFRPTSVVPVSHKPYYNIIHLGSAAPESMAGPTKPETIKLELARRQFFQFHIVENEPIHRVKELMDQLSYDTGKDFFARSVYHYTSECTSITEI